MMSKRENVGQTGHIGLGVEVGYIEHVFQSDKYPVLD